MGTFASLRNLTGTCWLNASLSSLFFSDGVRDHILPKLYAFEKIDYNLAYGVDPNDASVRLPEKHPIVPAFIDVAVFDNYRPIPNVETIKKCVSFGGMLIFLDLLRQKLKHILTVIGGGAAGCVCMYGCIPPCMVRTVTGKVTSLWLWLPQFGASRHRVIRVTRDPWGRWPYCISIRVTTIPNKK